MISLYLLNVVLGSVKLEDARKSQHYDYLHHTCLLNVDNWSDYSGVFQSFNVAVTTARNNRPHHHARNNKPVTHYMIWSLGCIHNTIFTKMMSRWWRFDSILSDDTKIKAIRCNAVGNANWMESILHYRDIIFVKIVLCVQPSDHII